MNRNLKYITGELTKRINYLFEELAKDYIQLVFEKESEICSFGVFTDSDISNFFFGYNTIEYQNIIYDEEVDNNKWWIPDWKNGIDDLVFSSDQREIELFNILKELKNLIDYSDDEKSKKHFVNYKEDVFHLICQSLERLKTQKVFNNINADFFMLIQESDNGIYGTREQSLSLILTQKQLDEYKGFSEL